MTDNQLEFVTFVIGSLTERINLSEAKIYAILKDADIISGYIVPAYDALHTFSKQYIVDDVIELMKEKGVCPC
ncbi:MAG: DUF3791 domain-containing protein [Clostridia bacterium]|nr:DUF3791 domain-containing protein [Clostridia bacterium]